MVREDLSLTRKDKFMLQAKVTELKNSMKSLLQQNQQLKLDLKHGKMKKVFRKSTCCRILENIYIIYIMLLNLSTRIYAVAGSLVKTLN